MVNKYMETCLPLLINREIKIQTTVSYHSILVKGYCQKEKKEVLARMWKKGNPYALLVEMEIGIATMKNNTKKITSNSPL